MTRFFYSRYRDLFRICFKFIPNSFLEICLEYIVDALHERLQTRIVGVH